MIDAIDVVDQPGSIYSKEASKSTLEHLDVATASRERPDSDYGGVSNRSGPESILRETDDEAPHGSKMEKQRNTSSQTRQKTPPSKLKRYWELSIWLIQDQWFLIGMGIIIVIASQVQVPQAHQHIKETIVTYLMVSIIFFVTGCTLPTKVLLSNYSRWKIHIFVQLQCFLMTSATTYAVVSACASNPQFMDPWLLIGLIFGGLVPTTISSNVIMTRQAHGNTALTVVESTLGNFLGPFLSPALLSMYTSSGAWYTKVLPPGTNSYSEVYRRVFKQLGLSLFLPMFVGQVVQNLFPKQTKTVFTKYKLSKLSPLALLVLIWQTYDQAFGSRAFDSVKTSNIIFLVFISFALFILWLAICFAGSMVWLPRKDVIACCYCCPAKALTILVPMSTVMYVGVSTEDKSKMQVPIVIYQALQVAMGSILTIIFRRWMRDEIEKEEEDKRRKEEAPANVTSGN